MRRSVLAAPGYESEPVLLARLAEAHWRLRERARAIETWFALCRLAPEVFKEMIESSDFPDWSLQHAWRVSQEQAVEHEVTPAWFPAWMLIEEPGLAGVFAPRHADDEPSRAFDLVLALLSHPNVDERGIELRRSLQDIPPGSVGAISGEAGSGHHGSTDFRVPERQSSRFAPHGTRVARRPGNSWCSLPVHIVCAYPGSARRHAGFRANVDEPRSDIEPHSRDRRSGGTGSGRLLPRACATRTHMNGPGGRIRHQCDGTRGTWKTIAFSSLTVASSVLH